MITRLLCVACLVAGATWVRTTQADEPQAKPNILLVYTDDQGWADLGAQGADRDIRTPNLDQLARDGVLFKRGYVTAPQCTPSRAGVITGMYQQRLGVGQNGIPLSSAAVTLPERLKEVGYVSGISGKWHLDVENVGQGRGTKSRFDPELLPHKQGFEEYFTGFLQDYTASHALDGTPFPDTPRRVHEKGNRVVIQTEAALGFLDRRAKNPGQPWFLYLAYMAPHVPLQSPEPWFSRTPPHLPQERRQALALIGAIDDGLGRIRNRLRTMGQERNTLIFFISDNGAPLGKAWDGSINLPMRGQKGMLSEGGIRVPFVAAWPGKIPGGRVYDHPVISLDVAATAVALAGLPQDPKLDGKNLIPFLMGEDTAAPHDTLYWRWMSQAAVLDMPYKLILLGERERLLFDVTEPDGEQAERNLVTKHPEIAARLEEKLKAWCDTLQPPGLPRALDGRHEALFTTHGMLARTAGAGQGSTEPVPKGSIKGWLARNGMIAQKDGGLAITADPTGAPNATLFITNNSLDHKGPIRLSLRVRAQQGGDGTVTWRTDTTAGFEPQNSEPIDWPASADWQEIAVDLPVQGRLIHLRIVPPRNGNGLEVQSIDLRDRDGKATLWRFDTLK